MPVAGRSSMRGQIKALAAQMAETRRLAITARAAAAEAAREAIDAEKAELMAQRNEVVRLTAAYEAILSEVAPDLLTRLRRAHRGD